MVSLRDSFKLSLDKSLKNRDSTATATLRLIIAAIKDSDIQLRSKKKDENISDQEILNLLQNMIKQRKESVKIGSHYKNPGEVIYLEKDKGITRRVEYVE